ncbi:hypothetical protein EJ05DRAFT_271801 [Pseudovirgaria hyperparasitica]|uniref:Vacuolar segregation subunit 7 n=1 Tax=Pseudovirgaria hyperparasitica TaxID=470096 RepID=A0A6A6WBL9_9PEZI|nr:uncharacterized protein EJ05DRAFT_271801 [Pseudovirgaria hyperparasitica]KAF2760083.1 hypothetical protein EJ05DRAFT_271801 [Pseudovirgaria hyperparasitica]
MPAGPSAPRRSRTHSQDMSPTRPPLVQTSSGTVPSAAAVQRVLSSTNTPQLAAGQTHDSKTSRLQKSEFIPGEGTPRWPVSPRIKSPPPSTSRSRKNSLNSRSQQTAQATKDTYQRKSETLATPNIVVQSSTPPSSSSSAVAPSLRAPAKNDAPSSDSDDQAPITMKGSARGVSGAKTTLETVQEGSLPNNSDFELAKSQRVTTQGSSKPDTDNSTQESAAFKTSEDLTSKSSRAVESGSESGENKNNGKAKVIQPKSATTPRSGLSNRSSFTSLTQTKSRSVNESKNMTVETETVPSIPQATIGAPIDRNIQGRSEASGSLRLKPSNETIRPKKERKKPPRKAPSVNSGTASSKADIFEAKVASAVDEADDSDSDETFVYESNPPDAEQRPLHHSRTPSATSMASLADQRQSMRSIGNAFDNQRQVPSKRSMKFASTYNPNSPDHDFHDRGDGTVRHGTGRTTGGSSIHHHHIGRHGRGPPSIFDSDSPFPHSSKDRNSRQISRPSSPRVANHSLRYQNGAAKQNSELSMYDMAGEAADDETTPLIGTVRGPRSARTMRSVRPIGVPMRHYDPYQRNEGGWLSRFAGCIVMTVMLVLLVAGAVGFLFATTKPLYSVKLEKIENVLASEQELMMDLSVVAINPNVISIAISDMDVNVFAKSKHVPSGLWWREHGQIGDEGPWISPRIKRRKIHSAFNKTMEKLGNKDDGTDPIDDPELDPSTMFIGRIFEFDSPLYFEGSALQQRLRRSVGEVRLSKPGNKTEAGGTDRWEHVIQYPFELIVRGVLKYELPLSSHVHTALIQANITVHPERGVDGNGTMFVETSEEHEAHGGGALFSVDST